MAAKSSLSFSQFIDLLLARLYELEQSQGVAGDYVDLNAIARQLTKPVPAQWTFDAGKVLESRGLANCIFALGGVCLAQLTGEGRLFVEENRGTGIIPQYKEAPQNFYVTIEGNQNQVAVGHGQQISQEINSEKAREPAFEVLREIITKIKQDQTLGDAERKDYVTDLEMVAQQLRKREPNRSALAALLAPFGQISSVAGLVGNLVRLINA